MTSSSETGDVLAAIAGIEPGTYRARLRAKRPDIVRHTQRTYLSLFEPDDDLHLSRVEREGIAALVARLSGAPAIAAWHRQRLLQHGGAGQRLANAAIDGQASELSDRETALFRHATLLTERPARAREADIRALRSAGISDAGIVTLAQLVAFLSFEIRTIATLRAIGEGADS